MAVPTAQPVLRRHGRRRSCSTRSSPVPGGTVLLTTTAWKPDAGGVATVESSPDVVQRAPQIAQIGAALMHRRRTDAEQGHIGPVQGYDGIRGRTEIALLHCGRHELVDARLDHRAPPGADVIDLHRVDIDAAYLMAS